MTVDEIGGMRWVFPSPHGDKFQHTEMMSEYTKPEFPSPHGDKFQRDLVVYVTGLTAAFPSPHGDKFQHEVLEWVHEDGGFRPLTGINFNAVLTMSQRRNLVSVPSRG